MDCVFCKIAKNELTAYTIYEDKTVKVFLDAKPDVIGHMLIIPKKHYQDIMDIDEKTMTHINNTAKKMYTLLQKKLKIDGLSLIQNNGTSQEIKHFHLHLRPYYIKNQKLMNLEQVYQALKNNN